jgi:hypothetical protein
VKRQVLHKYARHPARQSLSEGHTPADLVGELIDLPERPTTNHMNLEELNPENELVHAADLDLVRATRACE